MKSEIELLAAEWFARRDAGLTPIETRELEQWLAGDPRRAAAFSNLEQAWSAFGRPVRSGATDSLLEELASRRTRRRRRRAAFAAAAMCVLGFTAWEWTRPQPVAPLAPVAVVHLPNVRKLADGSSIVLRDGAEVEVQFAPGERRIQLLQGEAMFEVAKDPKRPFVVRANGVDVRAVGTAFAVQVKRGAVDVLVAEGTVSVGASSLVSQVSPAAPVETASSGADGSESASPVLVEAGNRVLVESAASGLQKQFESVPAQEIEQRLSWRTPRVEFNGMRLAEAVTLLNREAEGRTPTRLRIGDHDLDAVRVSGIFRTDNMDSFIFVLEASFGVKAERTDQFVVLRKAVH